MSKQLFLVGNKRSGTTLLTQLLCEHPKVFVSHESDIIWILYQCMDGLPESFDCYDLDACYGMDATLQSYGYIIASNISNDLEPSYKERLRSAFEDAQNNAMLMGSPLHPAHPNKKNLAWIGDKKPVQQCDPLIRPFIYDLFPDARFIHIVRHPHAMVSSKILYRSRNEKANVPTFWNESAYDILKHWARHEQWVLDMKQEIGDNRVLTVRLEDLAENPRGELITITDFLDVDAAPLIRQEILDNVRDNPNEKFEQFVYRTPIVAKQMMELYDYGVTK